FRSSDIIARLGGDEFVVLASVGPEESANSLIDRLQEKLRAVNGQRTRSYDLSVSIGVAYFDPDRGLSIEELTAQPDKAMYSEKRRKRSRDAMKPELLRDRVEAVA